MSSRRRERSVLPVRAEINVTSLVDVAFTLLVIFIITAPVLQGGVDVDVPEGDVGVLEASDDMLIVSIDRTMSVFVGETPVARDSVAAFLRQLLRARQVEMVYVKGDSMAYYGPVFDIVAAVAAQAGVGVSLIGREIVR